MALPTEQIRSTTYLRQPPATALPLTLRRLWACAETRRFQSFVAPGFQNNGGAWSERWFDLACTPPGVTGYDLCRDYSTRSQQLSSEVAATNTTTTAACTNPSGVFWSGYFQNIPGFTFEAAQAACAVKHLAPGVIDTKGGFDLTADFASVSTPTVFASGTAAARFTGNAYFAPGSTIGLALHTGYVVANAIPSAIASLDNTTGVDRIYKDGPIPALFLAGSWVIGAGVVAHVFGQYRLHYALMTIGAGLVFAAVGLAVGGMSRVMKDRDHGRVGRVATGLIVINVATGVAMNAWFKDKRPVWIRWFHRVTGAAIIGMVAYLQWSGPDTNGMYDISDWRTSVWVYLPVTLVTAYGLGRFIVLQTEAQTPNTESSVPFI